MSQVPAMLLMKPNCECCNRDLPPDSRDAMICSFECTFCCECALTRVYGKCPNCGGEFAHRPLRPIEALRQYPATKERTFKPQGCV
jgi:uncharacterized protein